MASDLWGPMQPPRWMSNYEQSLLNKKEGREAAASFNEAWNASYGRAQQGEITRRNQSESDYRQGAREAERDYRQDKIDAGKERRRMELDLEKGRRIRGGAESELDLPGATAQRKQEEFERSLQEIQSKLAPFAKSMSPANNPRQASRFGSPGTPTDIAPWASTPLEQSLDPSSTKWNGSMERSDSLLEPTSRRENLFGWQSSPITGESGPFDPTYDDFQRAKATHPGLWLDPNTAPLMQKMDDSWNQMERTRMLAEHQRDQHQAFEAKQQADQLALDVGKQGTARFGLRENAYQKAPSEIQMEIDAMPGGGRYPEDDPISNRLKFRPLTAAAENRLNAYLASQNLLRIDGANQEELSKREMEEREKAHPGGKLRIKTGPKGTERTYEDPPPGSATNAEPIRKTYKLDDGRSATVLYFPGAKSMHVDWGNGKQNILTLNDARILRDSTTGEDREMYQDYMNELGKERMGSRKPKPRPTETKAEEGPGFWDRVGNLFRAGKEVLTGAPAADKAPAAPAATNAPPATNAAPPEATSTNAPAAPKVIPKVSSQADLQKAQMLYQKALKEGRDPEALLKRLKEMGLELKQ